MRSQFDAELRISRPSTTPLVIKSGSTTGFALVAAGPGGRTWRRGAVEGRWMHGRALTSAVLATSSPVAIVRCGGATWAQCQDRVQTLLDATAQWDYDLTIDVDGSASTWRCEPADVTLTSGDTWEPERIFAFHQHYQITFPAYPIPTLGGI